MSYPGAPVLSGSSASLATQILSMHKMMAKEFTIKTPKLSSQAMQKNKTLDTEILNSLKEVMEDDFVELLPAYFTSSKQILIDLTEAQVNQNFEIMLSNAHSLKSSSASLGAMHLSSLAEALEQQCKNMIVVEPLQLDTIKNEYTDVEQSLLGFSAE